MKVYRYVGGDTIAHQFPHDRYIYLDQDKSITTLLLFSPDETDPDDDGPVRVADGEGLWIELAQVPNAVFEAEYKEDRAWFKESASSAPSAE